MRIEISNRQRKVSCDGQQIRRLALAAAEQCEKAGLCGNHPAVEVAIVSDAKISELHERFMAITGPTDVLTFDHGEIVIGAETAQANAQRYRHSVEEEIGIYIVHGLLHLSGFEDDTPQKRRTMQRRQRQICRKIKATIRGGNDH